VAYSKGRLVSLSITLPDILISLLLGFCAERIPVNKNKAKSGIAKFLAINDF
jgi:hypothetical protein